MTRSRLALTARIGFVVLTVAFAWWGFRGRWTEIGDAIAGTGPLDLAVSLALTETGVLLAAVLWRYLLAGLGSPVPQREAARVFLVGQLGKYIPGSVWTFAAQAQLGRRYQVPPRRSVTASGIFLLVHTCSGVLLGSALAGTGVIDTGMAGWWLALAAVGSAVPLVVLVSGLPGRLPGLGIGVLARALGVMLVIWACYGLGIGVLLDLDGPADLLAVAGIFALGHAAGVLLVIAPAGLGAREAVLIALLGPIVGVGPAAAAALLSRLVHAVADFAAVAIARAVPERGPVEAHVPVG